MSPPPPPPWFQIDTVFLTLDLNHEGASLWCSECLVFLIFMLVNFRCKAIFSFQAKSHVCSHQKTKVTTDPKSRINWGRECVFSQDNPLEGLRGDFSSSTSWFLCFSMCPQLFPPPLPCNPPWTWTWVVNGPWMLTTPPSHSDTYFHPTSGFGLLYTATNLARSVNQNTVCLRSTLMEASGQHMIFLSRVD